MQAAPERTGHAIISSFLGSSPFWYKRTLIGFLALNILLYFTAGPLATSWVILGEFIFTLAMALKCFPLQTGGLLALQALFLGLTDAATVYREVEHGLPVLLLVIYMVAGVHFLREMLFRIISRILLGIRSRIFLNFVTISVVALLSAFLDALTILAVLMATATGFYEVYNRAVPGVRYEGEPDPDDAYINSLQRKDLNDFRAMLRSLLMHGAVGTTIGGVFTLVGEPQNVMIGHEAGWNFVEFTRHVSTVALPTLLAGMVTCLALEKLRWFGYGAELPPGVRGILEDEDRKLRAEGTIRDRMLMAAQAIVAVLMVLALALHVAEIGLIGLAVIVLMTALTGVTDEHRLAKSFASGLPFASLLVIFYVIVAMIESQHMFKPVIHWVLGFEDSAQPMLIFLTNGLLSAISDNVFVATIYMGPLKEAFEQGLGSRELFDAQSVAVVMGTGIPGMSTPNGQAAFLFLLMSEIAPKIRLGYGRMVWMAFPYFVICTVVSGIALSRL
ncbi:MAG TPA: sodium/proton antiporter NhaB [Gammaproteobacteria bacterium]|nr:sodium/proton antiporter NhaB [Gammaproteobacteria bacterium]